MEILQEIIDRVPCWQGARDIHAEPIGGLTNINYRVTVDGEAFVLRVSGGNTKRLGINRRHEFAALQAAARAGIGPEPVFLLPGEGHLVTRWVEGRHLDVKEFRTPEHVRLLTETVQRIHALPPGEATFSPFQRVTAFLETARKFEAPLPVGIMDFLETMRSVQNDQNQDTSDWSRFCHNDLVSVNWLFIEKEQRIIILDWEFSGVGDLYYDLATLSYTHDNYGPIPPELEEVMLGCYFGPVSAFQRRRLAGMKYMLMLFNGMWGLSQYGMQRAELIPAVEGFDYLEFANYLFIHDIREMQAQYNFLIDI